MYTQNPASLCSLLIYNCLTSLVRGQHMLRMELRQLRLDRVSM